RTFDTISADKFPYVLPRISIAIRILVGRSEVGAHKLDISLVDPEGNKLMHTDVNINTKFSQESVLESSVSFAFNGQNIHFLKKGDYQVNVRIDGEIEGSIPLYVVERKP
ncbi:MAG: hypothetical protein NT079_05095, partial [Candidatus Omnitrophica bacterium]|nr:hypothetical protein [Candidatus Omnitrophota bacterium]